MSVTNTALRLPAWIAILVGALALARAPAAQEPVRVACLGDSITFGARLPDREHLAYPAQLDARLTTHAVRNFGVGGATLLADADLPFMTRDAWHAALDWKPDIAIVMLGTNDTVQAQRGNWDHARHLERDARALCAALRDAGVARILLAGPPPMFPDRDGLDEVRRADLAERAPRIDRISAAYVVVAEELRGVEFLDLARVFQARHTSDGVHPDPFGAERLAECFAGALEERYDEPLDLALRRRAIDGADVAVDRVWGFRRSTFPLVRADVPCTVIAPHRTRLGPRGAPWILRAGTLAEGPLAPVELDLLDRGFHVVRCADVSPDAAGATSAAAERWRGFIALMSTLGLGREPLIAVRDDAGATRYTTLTSSFAAPAELRALLTLAGLERNPATRAKPSAEYRAGAGWGDRTWHEEVQAMTALAKASPGAQVVFLGDSITQGLTGTAERRARAGGERAFDRLAEHEAIGLGLSGDRTEHLLWRIEHGALAQLSPRVIVLQIGVNNVNAAGHSGRETAAGIRAVLALLRERHPEAEVLVCGPFPAHGPGDPVRVELDRVHDEIASLAKDDRVHVVDLRALFLDADGHANERMRGDRLHINGAGQQAWIEALEPRILTLLEPAKPR